MEDKYLEFLSGCDNDQLRVLTNFLLFDSKGKLRLTENLSKTQEYASCYHNNDMKGMLPQVIDEFQRFGGDTIANAVRGKGLPYAEILLSLCDKIHVRIRKTYPIERIEYEFVRELLERILEEAEVSTLCAIRKWLDLCNYKTDKADICEAIRSSMDAPKTKVLILQMLLKTYCPDFYQEFSKQINPQKDTLVIKEKNIRENGISKIVEKTGIPTDVAAFVGWSIEKALETSPLLLVKEITAANDSIVFPCTLYIIYLKNLNATK